ncbi:hypothetical protein ACFQZZ_04940 [Nocardia sp. GCM10030253]|uniref:hypothetical protein n=1 Tax=Nocardia sp. GCM10030253 TaxID=3273404 RepID=UPI0036289231
MNGISTRTLRFGDKCDTAAAAGTNGMVVFGTGIDCYFSHRPMFSSPYDIQVLLDIELDERGRRALGADRRIGFGGIHCFDPEEFAVAELDPRRERPRTAFRGTLIRGHRERGWVPIAKNVLATVRAVVSFAQLDPHRHRGGELLTHLCFGRAGRLYLAHRIGRRPSFDQIVVARLIPGTVTDMLGAPLPIDVRDLEFERAQPIILGRREFTGQRLRTGEIAVAAFHATASAGETDGFLAEIAVERQVYLEVADLA